MDKLPDIMPTFWWVNPWATARSLRKACDALARAWTAEIDGAERLHKENIELTNELQLRCEQIAQLKVSIDVLEDELEARRRPVRQYDSPVSDLVVSACGEGLTLQQACEKYKLNPVSARTLACVHKVSFAWSGRGRKPKRTLSDG